MNEKRRCISENTECIDEICMCASFYKAVDGVCVTEKSKTLTQQCRIDSDCRGPGEFCSSFSICMCRSSHVDVGTQCKPVIYPGQHGCEDSIQCNKGFPGANCDVNRNCVCPVGFLAIQQTCVSNQQAAHHPPIRNEIMLQNEIMADHRTINQSFRGNFFRRRNYDGPRAYQIAPDLTCSYDNQCAGYPLAICHSVCQCVKGALNTGTTCIASSTAIQTSVACPAGQTYIREAGVCMTVQQPGEPCQYSQQCSALEPGAYCLKMRCECVYGMKKSSNGCTFVNNDCKERGHIFISEIGECREVFPPGGKGCSHNLQCSGAYPDATCFMQTCTCPPNLPVAADGTCGRSCPNNQVYSGVTGECLPEKQPGQDCIYSSQCQASFGGLVCDKNTCRCPNGLVFDGLKCSHGCPPHKRVIDKEICVEGCPSGIVEVAGRCVKQVSIGQPCVANAQCNFGSFCQSGTCQCPPGFYVQDEQCQAIESEPNESCQNNEKCTKGSVCYNGKCSCPRNHELINGHCQQNRAVPIGSACVRIGVTCDGGSVCVAGICVCPLGKTPRNGVCIEHVAARPGTSCQNEEECVDHSYCSPETNKCECMKASQMVIGGECRERLKAHPGYGCTMGEMCVGNSVCVNGKCACVDGKVEINKICIDQVSAKPGDTCGKGIICEGGSYCNTDSGKCACRRGENSINGICKGFTFVYPGDLCTDITSRCTGGSYCARGRCECPPRMSAIDKKCVHQQTAAPGEPCSEKVACSPFSVCENNVCKCVNNMMIRDKMCVQRRKVNIGNSCNNEDQCLGNSTCMDNNCQCGIGFVASMDVCVLRKTVTPGYLCNPEDICTGQSVCIKGVCQCQPDYKQMHNICVKKNIGIEGSPCSSRDDCGEGLMCGASGKCSCPEGLFSVNGKCRSYVQLGQTCTSDDRCAERNAQCQENYCTCRTGYTNINGQCAANIVTPAEPETLSQVKSGLLGHICTSNDHCKIAHSQCRRNVCQCIDGYRIFGSTQCIPRPGKPKERKTEKESKLVELGDKCDKLSLCSKGAICEKGVCSCPETFFESDGACVKNVAKIKVVVPPLSSCLGGEECSGNSECVHGICFCKEEFTLFEGKCQRLRIIEKLTVLESKKLIKPIKAHTTPTAASNTTPIPVKTTTTLQTTTATTLPENYVSSSTNRPLTPIIISMKLGSTSSPSPQITSNPEYKWRLSKPGHMCDNKTHCTNCSVCVNGFCRCPEGLVHYGDKCVSEIDATKCLASNQCPSGAQCVKGECRCKPGLGITRYGFCVPITFAEPGTSCAYGEHCQKDSHCEDGLCTCNEPLVLKENKCVVSPREQTRRRQPSRLLTECPRDGSCRLPSCFCTSTGKIPPNNFDTKQVPQMVMLSFDDPITDRIINTLKSLFSGSIRNPNGCAIKGTFFVSHQWNNYDQSLWLHSTNHEIGVNSITREDLSGRTQERWYKEQKGMRETLAEFSFIDRSHIIGTRAPELKIGGDAQYRMMSENNFTFDNSMLVSSPYWPQTLDHKLAWECDGNCPTQSHKAIWEIPIQNIQANDTRWYKTLTRAMKPFDSRDSVTKMLQRNFMNHYKTNRAPFILTLDTEFLTYLPDNGAVYALRDFLKFIVQKQDVFVVTGSQIIDYMRNPVDLNNIKSLRSWQCKPQMKDEANPCENPTTCSFSGRARGQFAHSFRMCGVCPKSYPWI
ncbi:EGF-like domain-containing protein [Caenorhabditis elegans]|uniref:EGF-like domain-containing protein n=1 Tax=Caenorhabditis elegans TaxID=6239 RepID=A0A8S4QDB1_CAEEL|nr:EGF-like domain-containing protein [Caenorhabditis elegans]CAH2190575.1 EGF-like domain-containing protein [Caenorhabditis elegans]